jgi:XTP/dITP diphosphohydrolase
VIKKLRFVSNNKHKIEECKIILAPLGVEVVPISLKINELQTADPIALVRHKALEAFDRVRHPLFVEHTGLYLKHLNDLPGGLTQLFWDRLEADRFSELFGATTDPSAIAKTYIGYVDGRKIHHFEGVIPGTIAPKPRGSRDFQWDCVFVPDGHRETFAELGDKKNDISMRKLALDSFAKHLG